MSTYVSADNIGTAWLKAFSELVESHGHLVNLVVVISNPLTEDLGVRAAVEAELARRLREGASPKPQSVHTVANTIFPISLYRSGLPDSAERFWNAARLGHRSRHGSSARWGTYIGRLVDYPGPKGRVNQLELTVAQLRKNSPVWSDRYELPVTVPGRDAAPDPDDTWLDDDRPLTRASGDLRLIADSQADHYARGGPCLAHVSLTLLEDRVHMTAVYRRQTYVSRALGNFLGLARLLNYLAAESGHDIGELMVVATHGEMDATHARARSLLRDAEQASGSISTIETQTRALGASWSDLDLSVTA